MIHESFMLHDAWYNGFLNQYKMKHQYKMKQTTANLHTVHMDEKN